MHLLRLLPVLAGVSPLLQTVLYFCKGWRCAPDSKSQPLCILLFHRLQVRASSHYLVRTAQTVPGRHLPLLVSRCCNAAWGQVRGYPRSIGALYLSRNKLRRGWPGTVLAIRPSEVTYAACCWSVGLETTLFSQGCNFGGVQTITQSAPMLYRHLCFKKTSSILSSQIWIALRCRNERRRMLPS